MASINLSKLRVALVATCITAATMLAPAQARADFIHLGLTANNPGTFEAGTPVSFSFAPNAFNQFDPALGTLTDVDIFLSAPQGTWAPHNGTGFLNFTLQLGNSSDDGSGVFSVGHPSTGFFLHVDIRDFFKGTGTIPFGMSAESSSGGTLTASELDATVRYQYTPAAAVPGPIVGAGLPGLILACGGLLALSRRRRLATA